MKDVIFDTKTIEREADEHAKRLRMIRYYEEAGRDYRNWSPSYHMHFGYFARGMNPFRREGMLNRMTDEVFKRFEVDRMEAIHVGDFGCGLGTSMRCGVRYFPNARFTGITLVPWQVSEAERLNQLATPPMQDAIQLVEGDYCQTPFPNNSFNAVYAIESSCYAGGATKADLLDEIHRVLKPGGRFVIADGFTKQPVPEAGIVRGIYSQLCNSWALTELANIHLFTTHARRLFADVKTEDISWKVAPSVAHVPFTVAAFLLRQIFAGDSMTKERWDNLKSPLLTMLLGSCRKHFGYYLVSGTKQCL